jgi:hypothetical protein
MLFIALCDNRYRRRAYSEIYENNLLRKQGTVIMHLIQ